MPEKLEKIGEKAFFYCESLESIKIPDNIKEIGDEAFYMCTNLSSVQYKGKTYTSKSLLENDLKNNGVIVGNTLFTRTSLKD